MNHHRRYPTFSIVRVAIKLGLVAFAVLLANPDVVAQRGRSRIKIKVEPLGTAKQVARPPKYKPRTSEAVFRTDPIRSKSTTRIPGSAQLRPIGKPFAARTGVHPPSVRNEGTKIVTVLPKSGPTYQHAEAFRNVFETAPSKPVSREVNELIGRFGEKSHNLGSSRDGPKQLRECFRDAQSEGYDSVLLVGHSTGKAGGPRELKLPDGSKVKLEEIHEWAAEAGLECRVVTCYGRAFGIDVPVTLGRVTRLLSDVAYPVRLTASKPSEAMTVNSGGTSKTFTNPGPSDAWDDWDDRFSQRRDELGYSDVILVGATRGGDGRIHVWESVRARPTWLALSSWLILIVGTLANTSVMRWMHRQELGSSGSLDVMEREAAEQFRRSRRIARVTVVATAATLILATMAGVLVKLEYQYNASTGRTTLASTVNVPAPIGVTLMTLSSLAVRVDPGRAWVARLIHAMSGAVAGTVAMFLRTLKFVGGYGLVFVVWVNILHVVACLHNGFANLSGLAVASLWWWVVIGGGGAALFALYGTYQGFIAGYFDLPVFLAVRVGVKRLETRRPLRDAPKAITSLLKAIWSFVGTAIAIVLICFTVYVVAMIILFCLDSKRPVEDASTWWGVAVGLVITTLVTLVILVSYLVDRRRQLRQQDHKPPFEGSDPIAPTPSSNILPSSPTPLQTQSDVATVEPIDVGPATREGRRFIVTPDRGVVLTPEEPTDEASPDPGLGLKSEIGPWPFALGWAVIALIVFVPSATYVNSLFEDPPHPVGTLVEFVGGESNDFDMIDTILYPPTVPVYQVPAVQTLPKERLLHDFYTENGLGLDLDLGPFSSSLLNPEQGAAHIRQLEEWIAAQTRHQEQQRLLREPSGVVFRREATEDGIVDGVVVMGSRGEVIADDQGGRGDRAVLVRLFRDPGLGEDPRVVVVARAADLRVLPAKTPPSVHEPEDRGNYETSR